MKKQLVAYFILLVMGAQFMAHFGYIKAQAQVIPNEAIRLRILANSDSDQDQALKRKVRDRVKAQIDTWVADLHSIDEARAIIKERIPQLEKTVAQVLKEEGSDQAFTVKFGKHIKFPTKLYGNFFYPAGEYEAVLITLGKGEGANWWCVLFPPLCFLDFASGTAIRKEDNAVKSEVPQGEMRQVAAASDTQADEEAKQDIDTVDQTQIDEEAKQAVDVPAVKKPANKANVTHIKQAAAKEQDVANQESTNERTETEPKPQTIKVETTEEPDVKVRFFIIDFLSSLFSK